MDVQPRKPYSSDLSDDPWALVAPLLPPPIPAGAPRETDFREVLNAVFSVLTNGCAWHALPHDLPPEGDGTVRLSSLAPERLMGTDPRPLAAARAGAARERARARRRQHRQLDRQGDPDQTLRGTVSDQARLAVVAEL
ncbi:MAG: transposase [Planctomycetaceae bacterium]|nr:transposase [Planctomycetaceae bacterium]MBV8607940.1 transposase [Singulisphaera sp.]MBV8229617.1 transposase [Planctomycetaceae bacterium]MBV8267523.1 transposase [Planctomycetaceae bacterium]MBV8318409.1 transposase [Planctomycetaceae bacterium]